MDIQLTQNQARVIGCLIEKEKTTPEYYPLTLNSLTAACNQKSSRDPVLSLTEKQVQAAVDELIELGHVVTAYERGSRVTKYRHRFCNSEFGQLQLNAAETAVVCLLLLRGAQTVGELRSRSGRLHEFSDLSSVDETLHQLAQKRLVIQLEREPGKRESKWIDCFGTATQSDQANDSAQRSQMADIEHLSNLDILQKVNALEHQLELLTQELIDIKQVLSERVDS